jgi:fumarate reductase subunit C
MHGQQTAGRPVGYPWHQPSGWWLKNNRYIMYMIRELTAVFAALWVVIFLAQIAMNGRDVAKWQASLSAATSPGWLVFSVIAFIFVMYHAWTAFTATSTLMYIRVGKAPIPPGTVNGSMFIAWLVATIIIAVILLTPILGV